MLMVGYPFTLRWAAIAFRINRRNGTHFQLRQHPLVSEGAGDGAMNVTFVGTTPIGPIVGAISRCSIPRMGSRSWQPHFTIVAATLGAIALRCSNT